MIVFYYFLIISVVFPISYLISSSVLGGIILIIKRAFINTDSVLKGVPLIFVAFISAFIGFSVVFVSCIKMGIVPNWYIITPLIIIGWFIIGHYSNGKDSKSDLYYKSGEAIFGMIIGVISFFLQSFISLK